MYDHITENIKEANATGMNKEKNQEIFFEFGKAARILKHNKKLIVDDKEATDQTHILECIKEFCETLLTKCKQKKVTEIKRFSVMSIFQNSLKIKQNFIRKI